MIFPRLGFDLTFWLEFKTFQFMIFHNLGTNSAKGIITFVWVSLDSLEFWHFYDVLFVHLPDGGFWGFICLFSAHFLTTSWFARLFGSVLPDLLDHKFHFRPGYQYFHNLDSGITAVHCFWHDIQVGSRAFCCQCCQKLFSEIAKINNNFLWEFCWSWSKIISDLNWNSYL